MEKEIRSINKTLEAHASVISGLYNGTCGALKTIDKNFKSINRFNSVATICFCAHAFLIYKLAKENSELYARVRALEEAGVKEC